MRSWLPSKPRTAARRKHAKRGEFGIGSSATTTRMFAGHLAVALGAKKVEPKLPLPVLVVSAFGADVLWPVFLLVGLETVRIEPGNTAFTPLNFVSFPWSHSLAMLVVWGAIAGHFARRAYGSLRA